MSRILLTLLVTACSTVALSEQLTVTLQRGLDDYNGAADTLLYAPSSVANVNYGATSSMSAGINRWGEHYVALLRFRLDSIPAGARVKQATLHLYDGAKEWPPHDLRVDVLAVTPANAGWSEGHNDGTRVPVAGTSCWNYLSYDGKPWTGSSGLSDEGVDYLMPPAGSTTVPRDHQEWIEFPLNPAVVQGWLDNSESNAGFRIYPLEAKEKGEYVHLRSSDWPDQSMRPKLVVEFDMSDEVAGQYWRTVALRVLAATVTRLGELEEAASNSGNPPRTAATLEELRQRLESARTEVDANASPAAAQMKEAIARLKAMQNEIIVTSDNLTLARGAAVNESRGLATDYALAVADSMTNVLRVPGLFRGEFAPVANLELAKNEFEPVQVCIVPVDADVMGATWSVTDLQGPGAVIPGEDVDVSVVGYMKSLKPALPTDVEWWPAPILDFMDAVDVARGEIQPLWMCVRTREDTPAGVYTGKLTVRASGLESKSVELEVRVFDFAIPKEQHLLTVWGNNEATLRDMYGDKYNTQMAHDFFQFLIDHRQSVNSLYAPQGTGASQGGEAGERSIVGYPTLSDPAELKALWDAGCRWWNLGYLHPVHAKDAGMEFEPYVHVFIERIRESLKVADAAGWPRSNLAIYCFDETKDFDMLAKAAAQVKAAFPDIAIMTTGYDRSYGVKNGPIDDVMDIWCPLTPRYVQDWDLIRGINGDSNPLFGRITPATAMRAGAARRPSEGLGEAP
ncbi:MAG: DNRLRE domain-containing protein, partial [bacterium]|nr:DNRLRE domain-containing protein [bacterium]